MLHWPASGAIIAKSNVALMPGQKIYLKKKLFRTKKWIFVGEGGNKGKVSVVQIG